MISCAINKILDKVEKGTKDKPSYTFDRSKKIIKINYGAGLKAKDEYSASRIAIEKANLLNQAVNDEVFLDNIFKANQNYIEIIFSKRYIQGIERLEELKNQEAYNDFIKETNADKNPSFYNDDYQLSEDALQEQELKETMEIIDSYIDNNIVKQICEL